MTASTIINDIEPDNDYTVIKNTIDAENPLDRFMVFSFRSLDRNEFFDFTRICDGWAIVLLEALKELSSHYVKEIIYNRGKNLSYHSDELAKDCPIKPPKGMRLKDLSEIRFSKSNGRIHGRLVENVFFVVWIDPLHNVFPDDRFGGIRKIRMVKESCCESLLEELDRKNKELEWFDECTKPDI